MAATYLRSPRSPRYLPTVHPLLSGLDVPPPRALQFWHGHRQKTGRRPTGDYVCLPNMDTRARYFGTPPNDATLHAMPIHSYRASPFKFRVPIWSWVLYFTFLGGLTSRSASAMVNPNWRPNRISQQHTPTVRPAPKASANAKSSRVEGGEKIFA